MAETSPSAAASPFEFSFPVDVIFSEILPKLPVKSLIRFKCVSKTFKTIISSEEFTQLYLRQYLTPSANRLLILHDNRRVAVYDLDASAPAVNFSWSQRDGAILIIGSCHGLLCIVRDSGRGSPLVLLNPSTRISLDIQMPIIGSGKYFGFGFDHVNLDYKIVAIAERHSKSAVRTRVTHVYSVNSNSWKVAKTMLPEDSMLGGYGGVIIGDHLLHWMFWSPSLHKRRIGCFDVCGDEWKDDVLLPRYYYEPEAGCKVNLFDFGVVDGCLFSLFENKVERNGSELCFFDVWVMVEYGVQDSWFKLLSIPSSEDLHGGVFPIAIFKETGEVLTRHRHSARLFWYNSKDNVITGAVFPRVPDFSGRQALICRRSLVSLPGGRAI